MRDMIDFIQGCGYAVAVTGSAILIISWVLDGSAMWNDPIVGRCAVVAVVALGVGAVSHLFANRMP